MPANIDPIYSRLGVNSTNDGTTMAQAITAAANDFTGAGANNVLIFTADATNGGIVPLFVLKPAGTNVASAMRFFLNNGSTNTTAANNSYIDDISLPATTATATAGTVTLFWTWPRPLQPGFRIYAGLATAVAAGWVVTPFGGKY